MDLPRFRSPALRSLCHEVVYWPPPTDDGHGSKVWSYPSQCWGRFIDASELQRSTAFDINIAYGSVIVDFFYIGRLPEVNGYIWHGSINDLVVVDRPPLEGAVFEIAHQIVRARKAQPMDDRLISLAILQIK